MRLPKHRRSRSWSKDRARNFGRRSRKLTVCAFAGGALLTIFVWTQLQSHGVPGPWARSDEPKSAGDVER